MEVGGGVKVVGEMGISGCHLVGSRRVVGGKDNEEGDVVICVDWGMGWGN